MNEVIEEVDDLRDIAGILLRLAREHGELEVRMQGATGYVLDPVYYSLIRDDQAPRTDEEREKLAEHASEKSGEELELRTAWSYLHEHASLLVEPLVPALGNMKIRMNRELEIQGVNGRNIYRFFCRYEDVTQVQGNAAVRLSFPRKMEVTRGRRHFRAALSDLPLPIALEVAHSRLGRDNFRLADLSAGGLSFVTKWTPEDLKKGDMLAFRLSSPKGDFEEIQFNGYLRNVIPVPRRRRGSSGKTPLFRCGVQLELASEAVSLRVEKTAAMIQRFALQLRQAAEDERELDSRSYAQ